MTAAEKVSKAIISMVRTDPFFAAIIMRHEIRPEADSRTISIDGKVIRYSPEWVNSMTDRALGVIMAHEAMHVSLGHHLRLAKLRNSGKVVDHNLFNIAADLAINSHLYARPGFPDEGLVPGRGDYSAMPAGLSMEDYLARLLDDSESEPDDASQGDENGHEDDSEGNDASSGDDAAQSDSDASGDASGDGDGDDASQSASSGSGDGSEGNDASSGDDAAQSDSGASGSPSDAMGEVLPCPVDGDADTASMEREYEQMVASAAMQAEAAGKLPGYLRELVDGILRAPQQNWRQVLKRFCRRAAKNRLTYSRPNRRQAYRRDVFLPTRSGHAVDRIAVIADTSGSMQASDLNMVLSEMREIMSAYPTARLTLIQCDTRIHDEREFGATSIENIESFAKSGDWRGRGGTDMSPAIQRAEELRCDAMIILTDGYMTWPEQSQVPCFWLMTTDKVAPWGMTVQMEG
jgi:predicted metal-dependent peptidase